MNPLKLKLINKCVMHAFLYPTVNYDRNHIRIYLLVVVATARCDSTIHSLSRTSSLTSTNSAKQLKPSIRTQLPILHFQDIMAFCIQLLCPTTVSPTIVQSLSRLPDLMIQLGPITTLGPILQLSSILLDSCTSTFPVNYLEDLML
jgi:hypothetical protein